MTSQNFFTTANKLDYNFYGLPVVAVDEREYAVALTDDEADKAAKEYIRNSVWAFNPEFLANHTSLDAETIKIIQDAKYEDANDPLLRLIENFDYFANGAIEADSRGHFLSPYDSHENTLDCIDGDDAIAIAELLDIDGDDWSGTYIYRLN